MEVFDTKLKDAKLLQFSCYEDSRGFFREVYNARIESLIDNKHNFIQDNESFSKKGVLRGLHYQNAPFEQSKLVRVSFGVIQDVIVDIRKDSNTYGHWQSFILSSENNKFLLVPRGFAHGFLVLSENAIVNYKVDNGYNSGSDSGLIYNDPTLKIKWELPENEMIISEKDKKLPKF